MFSSSLKKRIDCLSAQQVASFDKLWARISELERDFRLLLGALDMEVRQEEELKVPRQIVKREPETCCVAPEPHKSYKDGTPKRRKKGKRSLHQQSGARRLGGRVLCDSVGGRTAER